MQEAQIACDFFIEETQRMRHVHLSQPFQTISFANGVTGGRPLATAVERQHGGLLERAGMEGAYGMGQMMRHEMPLEGASRSHAAESVTKMMRRTVGKLA